jgi:hypothetical protein
MCYFGPTIPVDPITHMCPPGYIQSGLECHSFSTEPEPWGGPVGGLQFDYSWSSVRTTEYLNVIGVRTNDFRDSGSGFSGGFNAGYNWQPWNNKTVLGVMFDAEFLNDKVNHTFPGGTFIGSTVNFTASADVRAGVLTTPSFLIYGETGASFANQRLQIHFGGPNTDTDKVTPGVNLGGGVEWKLPTNPFPSIGHATTLFVEGKHIWWDKASLNTPVASPLFNYTWQRQSNEVVVGFRIALGAAAPVASHADMAVKAPPSK